MKKIELALIVLIAMAVAFAAPVQSERWTIEQAVADVAAAKANR